MEDASKQKEEVPVAIGEAIVTAFATLRRFAATRKAETICGVLLLLMAVNLFAAISRKSITNDEIVHIPSGYYHLVAGKFQLNNEHPPLVKMWAALPLLFIQPNESRPALGAVIGNYSQETWKYLEEFWPNNRTHFESISFWTRAMMIPITLGLGLLILSSRAISSVHVPPSWLSRSTRLSRQCSRTDASCIPICRPRLPSSPSSSCFAIT